MQILKLFFTLEALVSPCIPVKESKQNPVFFQLSTDSVTSNGGKRWGGGGDINSTYLYWITKLQRSNWTNPN